MNATFLRDCEAAAERFDLPALAAGMSVGGHEELAAVGCSTDAVLRVASITKPFTATVAVRELSLDDETGVWPETRVRELLSHTTGYACECGDLARFGAGDDALERLVDELPSVRRWLPSGQVWSYSNAGYWLAGGLAAATAGVPYESLVEALAGEIGLEATSFDEPELAGTGPGATSETYPRARRPSGGLVANVRDLLRFGRWQLTEPAMLTLRVLVGRPVAGVYGLGFAGERVGDCDVWGHGGSYGGFQSSFLVVPDRAAVFVGLTNSGAGRQALRELEDAFFVHVLGVGRCVPEPVRLEPAWLARLAGRYVDGEQAYEATVEEGELVLRTAGEVLRSRAIGTATFEIVEGERARERFDFPLPGFARIAGRLAERVA